MARKARKRTSAIPNPFISRNKWAVRGRAIGYFVSSLVLVVCSFLAELLIALANLFAGLAGWAWKSRPRRRSAANTAVAKAVMATAKQEEKNPEGTKPRFAPLPKTEEVSFENVIGLEDAKEQIIQRMVTPFSHPEAARALGVARGGGILLVGPPGTGKTTLAKAVANMIDAPFFHIMPKDLIRPAVGDSEALVAELFATLRNYPKAVLFLDEVEAILTSRSKTGSTIMKRVVPQFLAEWQGIKNQDAESILLLIGASNEPWDIDYACRRPGRFDYVIYVDLPNLDARRQILRHQLNGRLLDKELNLDALAAETSSLSGADLTKLVDRAAQMALKETVEAENGCDICPISQEFLKLALEEINPSVSEADLRRFKKFCGQYAKPVSQ